MKKLVCWGLILSLSLFVTVQALADQAEALSEQHAKQAHALLLQQSKLRFFCAPCAESRSTLVTISQIRAGLLGYESYWGVWINDESIDLAYTYFLHEGKWTNVAIHLDIPVSSVPETLDEALL